MTLLALLFVKISAPVHARHLWEIEMREDEASFLIVLPVPGFPIAPEQLIKL